MKKAGGSQPEVSGAHHGNVLTALTSRRSARRYNYCPGCGTALDTELQSLDARRKARTT
jgi:hypothetical protein